MSGRPPAPAPPHAPGPPRGRARPPPAAPSLPRLGFAFFWHRLLWGFSPFFGVSSVPLGSRVCVRGNIAIYNVSGGQGQSPGEWDGGWGLPRHCPAQGGPCRGTPSPCMSPHPSPSSGPNVVAAGPQGAFGTIHTSPPGTPSRPSVPPGGPTRPQPPHVTSRQVSSPQRDPHGGRHGAAGTPAVPPAVPRPSRLHPNPMPA